jgi:hypothetical protein
VTPATSTRGVAAVSLAIAAAFLAIAVPLLPDYGPTFDAVLGDYAYGEYLLEYLRTGNESWLRFEPGRLEALGHDAHPEWRLTFPLEYVYPVPAILSALGCEIFARDLGWLHPIDAHHLIAPVSIALLLACLFLFVARRAGWLAGALAVASFALHPHVFGHAMNDIKDAPMMLTVFAAAWAFARVLETGSVKAFFVAAVLTGVGFATKINAIWPAAFFAAVWLAARLREPRESRVPWSRVAAASGLAIVLCAAAYLLCSPQYRVDGLARFVRHLEFMTVENTRVEGKDAITAEPLLNLARTAPSALLPLAILGLGVALRRGALSARVVCFFALLVTIPVLRPCLPGMRYYNLVRTFLEVFPFLAIFSGIGLAAAIEFVASRIARGATASRARAATAIVAGAIVFVPQAIAIARSHPWQTAWFHPAVGGLAGAQAANVTDADDFWCHSCRAAAAWLNENADPGAVIVDPFTPWMLGSLRKSELRADLAFIEADEGVALLVENGLLDPDRDRARWERAKVVIVTYVPQSRRYNQKPGPRTRILEYCERVLSPWHVIRSRDGGEIVRFYRIETTR